MTATLHDLLKSYREGGVFPSYDQLAAIAGQDQGGAAVRPLPSDLTEREEIDLLCQVEAYMAVTEKHSQTAPEAGAEEARMYSLVNSFIAKRFSDIGAAVRGEAVADDLLKTWPDEIWLQGDEEILGEFQGESETVTWCSSQQYGGDVRYIRADLASHVSARAADAPSEPSDVAGGTVALASRLRNHAVLFVPWSVPAQDIYAAADALDSQASTDEPTEREALIACLGDDAVTLLRANPDDEMAQTMREAAAMLENDGKALDSQPTVSAVLAELRADLRELANNTEAFGEYSQEAARVAFDSATDALDEVAAKYVSSQPTDGGVRN